MGDTWQLAAKVRRDFADVIEGLDEAQLDGPTLSGDWTARHILGHLVFIAEMKIPSFFFAMAKAGFNYDKMADIQARKIAERPLDDLLSSLRTNAAKSAPMPGFAEGVTVADVAVHTQDIRRPNNIPGTFDDDVLTAALDASGHRPSRQRTGRHPEPGSGDVHGRRPRLVLRVWSGGDRAGRVVDVAARWA